MKRNAVLKFLLAFFVLGLASLACSLTPGPPSIGEVVTAKGLDSDYKPVDPTTSYTSDDTFYVSVEVKDLIVGSVVNVKYTLDGEKYEETSLTADQKGSGFYGFKLTPGGSHTPGEYTAEVYLDDKLIKSVPFTVKASGPPSIGDVVPAKSLDEGYKPIDPTTVFAPTDVFYISIQVKNLVKGSVVSVKYKLAGEEYSDSDTVITADKFGSGYYGFNLSSSGEHPAGKYSAEVSLDGKLVETVEFEVK